MGCGVAGLDAVVHGSVECANAIKPNNTKIGITQSFLKLCLRASLFNCM